MVSLYLGISILTLLLLVSSFFSASETSFTASSPSKFYKIQNINNARLDRLFSLLNRKEDLISIILFGSNAFNIFASSIATGLAINYLSNIALLREHAVEISAFVMTLFIVIFVEIVPKTIAIKNPERFALYSTDFYFVVLKLFRPVLVLIKHINVATIKIFKVKQGYEHSAIENIRGEIEFQHAQGNVIKNDRDMLGGVLDLTETEIQNIMMHKQDVTMIDISSASLADIKDTIIKTGHTRIPVYDGEQNDTIIGVLHFKNFFTLLNLTSEPTKSDISAILIKPYFSSYNTNLKAQLMEFRKNKNHLTIVVDEYGSMVGIVTLEDILEEIVGDISDEHDVEDISFISNTDGTFTLDGDILIIDFNKYFTTSLPMESASTIAGIIIETCEKIPNEQDKFLINGIEFEVLEVSNGKIMSVKCKKTMIS